MSKRAGLAAAALLVLLAPAILDRAFPFPFAALEKEAAQRITDRDGEIFLLNAHIAPYDPASRSGHAPRRPRKLLLRKRELSRLIGAVRRDGMTLVPLSLYFNDRGLAKVALALARGKKLYDKRASLKARDWAREKQRLLRDKG